MALFTLSGPSATFSGTVGDDSFIVAVPPASGTYTLGESLGVDKLVISDSSIAESISFNFNEVSFVFNDGPTTVINPVGIGSGLPAAEFVTVNFEESGGSVGSVTLELISSMGSMGPNVAAVGTSGRDVISAGGFAIWEGVSGRSYIFGGDGGDKLTSSNEFLFVLEGGKGNDRLNGTNGMDDILYGGQGRDSLFGLGSGDELSGGDQVDRLFGGKGGDDLDGGKGNDVLNGGKGNDVLEGGLGTDTLLGGKGADEFLFSTTNEGRDTIESFQLGIDKVILDGITATDFSILAQSGGGALVTVLDSGQQIFFDNLSATTIQSNAADIFELG